MMSPMIIINKSILHILDRSQVIYCSDDLLNIENEAIFTYLEKQLTKLLSDREFKPAKFIESSVFTRALNSYKTNEELFINLSSEIAKAYFDFIIKSDEQSFSKDLLVCDFSTANQRLFCIILLDNKVGHTHHVINTNGRLRNEIIQHYAVYPSASQKIEDCVLIDLETLVVKIKEKTRYIDGKDINIFADSILECQCGVSAKEALKTVNSITRVVAEKNGVDSISAITRVKSYILDNSEISDILDPIELGTEVFQESEEALSDYQDELKNAGLVETIAIDKGYASRSNKSHKIRTDTGIEITFPANFYQNKEYFEILNNPDGTISIQIKNIGKITSR